MSGLVGGRGEEGGGGRGAAIYDSHNTAMFIYGLLILFTTIIDPIKYRATLYLKTCTSTSIIPSCEKPSAKKTGTSRRYELGKIALMNKIAFLRRGVIV